MSVTKKIVGIFLIAFLLITGCNSKEEQSIDKLNKKDKNQFAKK